MRRGHLGVWRQLASTRMGKTGAKELALPLKAKVLGLTAEPPRQYAARKAQQPAGTVEVGRAAQR